MVNAGNTPVVPLKTGYINTETGELTAFGIIQGEIGAHLDIFPPACEQKSIGF